MPRPLITFLLLVSIRTLAVAAEVPERMEWTVDGVKREALVYIPAAAKTTPSPVVFDFHGHGGTMRHAARRYAFHQHWPQAIAVYMQGLNTPGALTDPEGKRAGWQKAPGAQDDRDLKFFDAVLATLKQTCRVDDKRIYATGHSNGGGFTYVLWAARGEVFAAVAPCAAFTLQRNLKPKPVLHVAGEKDNLVRFAWQQRTIDELRKLNGCDKGEPWGEQRTLYPSRTGTPVVAYIYPGGHELPADVSQVVVKFFQEFGMSRKDRQ